MSNTDKYRTRLINLLKELFQLDQPELDFGLYKIMHAKSVQITRFLENDLLKEIRDAFGEADGNRAAEAQAKYEAAIEQARKFGAPNPEETDGVKEAKAAFDSAKDGANAESEVYDHLYRFFERYYDSGDFMSRRYYARESDSRAAPYAVPYDGREVYLHWANKDQYYIKSSEYLTNYTFDLNEAIRQEGAKTKGQGLEAFAVHDEQPLKVHFRIVEASEGEHGNIKAAGDQKRFFILHADKPIDWLPHPAGKNQTKGNANDLSGEKPSPEGEGWVRGNLHRGKKPLTPPHPNLLPQGEGARILNATALWDKGETYELIINFQYRTDAEKTGQDNKWQETLLQQAEAVILEALKTDTSAADFLNGLTVSAPTDSKAKRTLLGKYLQKYAARNTMDYFIHKDLGGFLRRELDFYIKNEIMRLDDIENADAPKVEQYLVKIRVLRRIAQQLIAFLAQLEDFQLKLWLKKKFVTETHYCITLDRVPEKFYAEIAANDKQLDEWEKLFAISEINANILASQPAKKCTPEFLKNNPFLLLDTALFSHEFKERLLAELPDLDAQCDGILIHSENFQALELMRSTCAGRVSNIFIDPPYNTGDDGFMYKDSYASSSWLSMADERIGKGIELLANDGVFFVSIGDEEQEHLSTLLRQKYGKGSFFATLIWEKKKKGSFLSGYIAKMKDYILCVAKNQQAFSGLIGEIASDTETYPCVNASNPRDIRRIEPGIESKFREKNYMLEAGSVISAGNMNLVLKTDLVIKDGFLAEELIIEGNWRYSQESMKTYAEKNELYITQDLYLRRIVNEPRYKRMKDILPRVGSQGESDFRAYDINDLGKYGWGTNEDANDELHQLMGEQYASSYPKPSKLLTLLLMASRHESGYWLDYFAGSGTTAHAVINLNREDQGKRKYILVEQGDYFDTVLKPRIQKVVYSKDWKDGKPVSRAGISHCFKTLRLESYEDALNNLVLKADSSRDIALANNQSMQRDYLLNYFLDVETQGSQSLLNIADFRDPTAYRMQIKKPGSDEQSLQNIDLIETFNWLIGLWVKHMATPQVFSAEFGRETDPDLPKDQNTRLICKRLKPDTSGDYWFRLIEGYTLKIPGDNTSKVPTLIVWRKQTDDAEKDNAVLQTYLMEKLQISPREQTYGVIYINGSHTLPNPVVEGEKTRVRLIEEAFHNAMWSGEAG